MSVYNVLRYEGEGFLYLLGVMLGVKLLTGRIALSGLFARKNDPTPVSPERIQLLAATLTVCGIYLGEVLRTTSGNLPDVSPQLLYIFGGSGGVYASVKAFTTLKGK